jgi:dihydrofolate reductase
MRKLIVEEWVSLDGYVTDKQGALDFFTSITKDKNIYSDADQLKFMETIDTVLLGRKTYELFIEFWPNATSEQEPIADRLNELPKLVFSNTLTATPWGRWDNASLAKNELTEEIKKLKSMPGKNIVLWGSISVVQQLMMSNLIDEYHLQVCPVLNGGGRKLFETEFATNLNLLEVRQYNNTGTIFLSYAPKV